MVVWFVFVGRGSGQPDGETPDFVVFEATEIQSKRLAARGQFVVNRSFHSSSSMYACQESTNTYSQRDSIWPGRWLVSLNSTTSGAVCIALFDAGELPCAAVKRNCVTLVLCVTSVP